MAFAGAEMGARLAWFGLVLALGCLLPQRDFGAWSLLMALVGLVEIGLTFGLHGPAVRWLYDRDEPSYRQALFTLLLLWLALSGLAMVALDRLGAEGFQHLVSSLPWLPHGRLALGIAWVGAASALPLAMLTARRQVGRYAWLRVATVLGPVGGVLVILVLGRTSTASVLTGQLAGGAPLAILALAVGFAASRPKVAWGELRPMLAFGLPVLPHMMAQWVLSWSDRWLLGALVDLETVAVYHLAYLPALGALLLGGALNRAWYPLLYQQLEALDQAEAIAGQPPFTAASSQQAAPRSDAGRATWEALGDQTEAFLAGAAALGAGVALWSGELLRALPLTGYHQSPGLTAFTVAGTTCGLLYLLPHNLLYHHRSTARIPWLTAVAAGSNILLNLALIPQLGALGAALATVAAYSLLAALFWWAAHRVSRRLIGHRRLLITVAPGLAAMTVAMLLGLLDPPWALRLGVELAATAALGWALVSAGTVEQARRLLRAGTRS